MKILKLGAEGGSVCILEKRVKEKFIYYLHTAEYIDDDELSNVSEQYESPAEAWQALTKKYRAWYMLYPLHIFEDLKPLVQDSLKLIPPEERFNREVWEKC